MPQTIVETQNYSKPRKCDVPVSNFATLGKGDDSPTGSDSSLDGLFTNCQSSKISPCADRETIDDRNEGFYSRGFENSHLDLQPLNLLNNLYSDCDFSNGGQINNNEGKEIRYSNALIDSSPNKPLDSNNMGIVKDTESEILGDISDLLSSITSPNKDSNDFSFESKTYHDALVVTAPTSHEPDFNFCRSSSWIPKGSLNCEISNSQNIGTLSDILSSISLEENNSTPNGLKSTDSNLSFENFEVACMNRLDPEFSKVNPNFPANNLKPKLTFEDVGYHGHQDPGLESPSFNWDTICFDLSDHKSQDVKSNFCLPSPFENDSAQSKLKSSISFPDSNLHVEDIKDANVNRLDSNLQQTNSDPQNHDTLSDILSSISPSKDIPNSDTPAVSNSISKSEKQNALLASWADFNDYLRVPSSRINVPGPSSIKSSMHSQKNGEFSFFSISPENVFSDMVSKLRKDIDLQDHATDNDSAGISMLDLFKSVNSDSSSSLSEYLSIESEGSVNDKSMVETVHDLCDVMDIDLSSCVKSRDDTLNNISSDKCVIEDCSDTRENYCDELQVRSFVLKSFPETCSLKCPRMNLKQGLFAKSLSCKPKKNPVLLQKVARIKSELFETYFNHPFPSVNAKKSVIKDFIVNQSNNCMITFHGRRVCTSEGLEDVKCI